MGSSAPDNVRRLVDHFDRGPALFTDPRYNEAQLRKEFLDPFFKALGWDMDNEQGLSGIYKPALATNSRYDR
jgi:hypothetical protein